MEENVGTQHKQETKFMFSYVVSPCGESIQHTTRNKR